ncbi:MAG: pyridoxal kinase [Pseudomonadota bacterium]
MPVCLSIQSLVVAGAVGHGASAFALAAEGVEVWPLPTVVLSGHAATPGVRGEQLTGTQIAALAEGVRSGGLAQIDALLLGYLSNVGVAEGLGPLLRHVPPGAAILCDPVLGDDGRLYLPEAMIAAYREHILPYAQILTPNVDELGWLTGMPVRSIEQIRAAAQSIVTKALQVVHITSVPAPRKVGIMTVTAEGAWLSSAPKAPLRVNGAGDFVAALLLAERLRGVPPEIGAARVTAATGALAQEALRLGRDTLPVVAAQRLWQAERHKSHPVERLS